jgi:hypothetical protein
LKLFLKKAKEKKEKLILILTPWNMENDIVRLIDLTRGLDLKLKVDVLMEKFSKMTED